MRALRKAYVLEKHPRRHFLKNSVRVVSALPMAELIALQACATVRQTERYSTSLSSNSPVTIIGGGLSGLTAAYRLKQAGIPCEIYEAASRLGGRVFTHRNFNTDGMFCELGGEFIDSSQQEILNLARELQVEIDDLKPVNQGLTRHLYHFGGRYYPEEMLVEEFAPLAKHLAEDTKNIFADPENPVITYDNHTPDAVYYDKLSLADYLHSKRNDVAGWVLDALEVAYLGEFGLDTQQQPALNLMVLLIANLENAEFQLFGASDESKRIKGGNSGLVEALTRAISDSVPVHLEHPLTGLKNKDSHIELAFNSQKKTFTKNSNHVVLTLPFTLLRKFEGLDQLGLNPTKLKCIRELGYGTNSKYMTGFTERLWRKTTESFPPSTGYSFTDLGAQCFWDTSCGQEGSHGIMTNFVGGTVGDKGLPGGQKARVKQMNKIFPGVAEKLDGKTAAFEWSHYPFTRGSYTCPTLGQYTTILGCAKEPELDGKLLFAGEHVSEEYQGYMNGAVETANNVSQTIITALASLTKQK